MREFAQAFEEARRRRNQALEGLDDNAGELVVMLANEARDGLQIVEGCDQDLIADTLGDAGQIGDRLREIADALGREAHEPVVAHAVVAALKFQDLIAVAKSAGQPHGVEVRLRAGAHEPHLFGARHRFHDFGGQTYPIFVVGKEGGARGGDFLHHLHHLGMRVADDHRARAQQVVNVLIAAHVPDTTGAPRARTMSWDTLPKPPPGRTLLRGLDQ